MSQEKKLHKRPGRLSRTHTYPPFAADEGVTVRPGTDPIYLYLRLSKYHRDGADAIERQRIDLHRHLAAEGNWTIMGEYIDNDSASASAVRTRRGWHALNHDIDAGAIRAVAFWKLDRTNRIAVQIIAWLGHCRNLGVHLVSHQDSAEELNTASASAKIVTGIKALFAEIETDTMSTRQLGAKAHAAEAGFNHGGTVPFGWKLGSKVTDELGRTGTRLVPHEVEHPALQAAVEMALVGKSLAEIGHFWADDLGIVTTHGRHLHAGNIYRYLTSPRIVGYRPRNVPKHQRGVKIDRMAYVVRDSKGEPIISQEPVCDFATWQRVLRVLDDRTTKGLRAWGANGIEWILTGLLRCPGCHRNLYGGERARTRASGERIAERIYTCRANARVARGTCPGGASVNADDAEAFVLAWLSRHLTPERLAAARAELAARDAAETPESKLLRALEDLRAERNALLTKQGTNEYRGAMVGVLLGMLSKVTDRIDGMERRIALTKQNELPTDAAPELMQRWPAMSLSQKRHALGQVIERIDVRAGRAPVEERITVMPRLVGGSSSAA